MPRKARVKKTVARELKRVTSPQEAQEIIEELQKEVAIAVETQPTKRVPGLTVGGTKTSYTFRDLCEMFPIVAFIPEETVGLTFQGIRVQALSGIELHAPSCFKKIYDNHRKAQREAGSKLPDTGYVPLVELGAGALPPRSEE